MKSEFYLKDELQYTMSGKTLRCILNQLQKEAKVPFADISQGQLLHIGDVSVSLPKQIIINEIDKRIDRLYKHSEKVKGAEKKSYEDTCTSFVLFKMWLQEQ